VNGWPVEYDLINGTFEYDVENLTYSTANATLVIYNAPAGSNIVEIVFEGSLLGKADPNFATVSIIDAYDIARFDAQLLTSFATYDYPDVNRDGSIDIVDAFDVAKYDAKLTNEYYQ